MSRAEPWLQPAVLWPRPGPPPAALAALCDALNVVAPRLHFLGKQRIRQRLAEALSAQRQRRTAFAANPALAQRPITRPIVMAGPFRTGTTLLQRLLAEDPRLRGMRPWEAAYAPRGDVIGEPADPRIALLSRDLQHLYRHQPVLQQLHPVAVNEAEECFGLLEASLLSPSFLFLAPLDRYLAHLEASSETDWDAAYAEYADQLRALEPQPGARRWLLKSPVHLWNLGALQRALPGALVVHTHRDPAASLLSLCRLVHAHHGLAMAAPDPLDSGRSAWRFLAAALPRAVAARRAGGQHLDITFDTLQRDPLAAVRQVLDGAGMAPPDAATDARMRQRAARAATPTADARNLSDFGLQADAARALFAEHAILASFAD